VRGLGLVNCRVCIEGEKRGVGGQRAVYDSIGENSFMLFAGCTIVFANTGSIITMVRAAVMT
jgi:hypothetical protein